MARFLRALRRTRFVPVLAAVAISAVLAAPAFAAGPAQTRFAYVNVFTDPDVCAADGLVLDVVERVSGVFLVWEAMDGSFLRSTVSVDVEFDIAGSNGVTLYEKDHIVRQFTTDGFREMGLWEHVRGPRGTVVIDAGQLVFDNDGNVLFEAGQHDFFHGDSSFCPGFFE
jgi:hypothetical protein